MSVSSEAEDETVGGVGEGIEGGKRTLSTKSVSSEAEEMGDETVGEGREGGKRTRSTKSVSSEAEEVGDETVGGVGEGREGGKRTLSTKSVSSEADEVGDETVGGVGEALEGAKCVLGAMQFGNDPGFSKHDWDCDDYTERFTCTSLPLNPSELTDLVDSVHFPPSLPSRTGSCSHTSPRITMLGESHSAASAAMCPSL